MFMNSNPNFGEWVIDTLGLLKTDLKRFAKKYYHSVVPDLPVFVEAFNKEHTGYQIQIGTQAVYTTAEWLCEKEWE
jgi:hypothetical protein